jgi:hypothetical protein
MVLFTRFFIGIVVIGAVSFFIAQELVTSLIVKPSKYVFSAPEISDQLQSLRQIGNNWFIAKPLAAPSMTRWNALRGAWAVIQGKAFACRWE